MLHDYNEVIFSCDNGVVSYGDMVSGLKECKADNCDVLFVHSDISFGIPAPGVKRAYLKEVLIDILRDLSVETLIFPTFTFSFCNKEDYDVQNSSTRMGMLPEYVRTRQDAIRTDDPIMSVAIMGNSKGFERMSGDSPCGRGGIFDQLHNSGKRVKFLFFGTFVTKCFTFLHYVEEIKSVPYRYSKEFTGKVIECGCEIERTISLYVRYKDVIACLPEDFESNLIERGILRKRNIGNSSISVVDEKPSYEYISNLIDDNKYVFSILPENGRLVKEYAYGNVTTM